jgi:hypothetical protein
MADPNWSRTRLPVKSGYPKSGVPPGSGASSPATLVQAKRKAGGAGASGFLNFPRTGTAYQ